MKTKLPRFLLVAALLSLGAQAPGPRQVEERIAQVRAALERGDVAEAEAAAGLDLDHGDPNRVALAHFLLGNAAHQRALSAQALYELSLDVPLPDGRRPSQVLAEARGAADEARRHWAEAARLAGASDWPAARRNAERAQRLEALLAAEQPPDEPPSEAPPEEDGEEERRAPPEDEAPAPPPVPEAIAPLDERALERMLQQLEEMENKRRELRRREAVRVPGGRDW